MFKHCHYTYTCTCAFENAYTSTMLFCVISILNCVIYIIYIHAVAYVILTSNCVLCACVNVYEIFTHNVFTCNWVLYIYIYIYIHVYVIVPVIVKPIYKQFFFILCLYPRVLQTIYLSNYIYLLLCIALYVYPYLGIICIRSYIHSHVTIHAIYNSCTLLHWLISEHCSY